MSAELTVRLDGSTPLVTSGTITTSSASPLFTTETQNPSITGVYSFALPNVTGVAAANNYLSLFNPLTSGKSLVVGGTFISSVAAGGSSVTSAMVGYRTTAASAGTLQGAAAICKFKSSYTDSVAEVRTANPTTTNGAAIAISPPVISATTGSTAVHQAVVPPGLGGFILAPGEGIVLNTDTGDTDQRWNITIVWGEI